MPKRTHAVAALGGPVPSVLIDTESQLTKSGERVHNPIVVLRKDQFDALIERLDLILDRLTTTPQ